MPTVYIQAFDTFSDEVTAMEVELHGKLTPDLVAAAIRNDLHEKSNRPNGPGVQQGIPLDEIAEHEVHAWVKLFGPKAGPSTEHYAFTLRDTAEYAWVHGFAVVVPE